VWQKIRQGLVFIACLLGLAMPAYAATPATTDKPSAISFETIPDPLLLQAQATKLAKLAQAGPPPDFSQEIFIPAPPPPPLQAKPIAAQRAADNLPDAFVVIDNEELKNNPSIDQRPLLSAVPTDDYKKKDTAQKPQPPAQRTLLQPVDRYDPNMTLQAGNRVVYQLVKGDSDTGVLQAYSSPLGTFLPVKELLRRLRIPFTSRDGEQGLIVTLPDKSTLAFNFRRGQYEQGGHVESMGANDYLVGGLDFYLNYEFLNNVLPVGLSINQAAEKITVIDKAMPTFMARLQSMRAALAPEKLFSTPDQNYSPANESGGTVTLSPEGPEMSVVIDDTTTRREASAPPAAAPKPAETSPAMVASATPSKSVPDEPLEKARNDDGTLILQPKLKNYPPDRDILVEALEQGDTVYLPLADMTRWLDFDIKVDGAKGTAQGTSLDLSHAFALDVKKRIVKLSGQTATLPAKDAFIKKGMIYVSTEAFSSWFGINTEVDRKMMNLHVTTDKQLPGELREARHAMWQKLMTASDDGTSSYLSVENPYALATIPFIDVNLSSTAQLNSSSDSQPITGSYTILGAGDLGYLTTEAFVAGSSEQYQPDTIRLRAGRQDPTASLLGPLRATGFSIGDVDSPALSLVTTNSLGRGMMVTNRKVGAQDNFDTHTFNGDAVPGWEAELYRNNVLLAFQTVDANGRYEFKDTPILYGNSSFRIVLYGPQGQIEERTENIMVGDRMLTPGQVEYSFSANEKNKELIDLKKDTAAGAVADPEGLRMVAETRYGIADNLTAGVGAATTKLQDGQHSYASASVATSFYDVFTEANAVKDLNDGWAAGVTALTSIDDISLRMRHRMFHNFLSEDEDQYLDPRTSETDIDANTQFYLPLIQDIGVGLEAKRETFTTRETRMTFTNRLSKSLWGMSLSNTVNYIKDEQDQMRGTFGLQTRFDKTLIRAAGDYEIKPEMGINGIAFTTEYRLASDLTGRTEVYKGMSQGSNNTLTQGLNWDLDSYRLSFSTSMDDQLHVTAGVSLIFSVGHDSVFNRWRMQRTNMGNGGAIAGRVFVDDNYNGKLDKGEKVLPDTTVRVNRQPHKVEDGNVFIAPVMPYQTVNVTVDPNSIKDPLLGSSVPGYKVTTRPGDIVETDFPLVATSSIDGNIKMVDSAGNHYQIPDIVVELQDGKGKMLRRVVSEYDGFYTFDKIRSGDYKITIPPEALAEYNAYIVSPIRLKIDKVSDFYSGKDIVIRIMGAVPAKLLNHKEKKEEDE
jgi:hypothetical protein